MTVDDELRDLSDALDADAAIEIVVRDDERALELIRHDAAHVMAEAVQELWPGTQVTIGPVIENGFYYDFFHNEPFTTEDLPVIEAKMREIIQRNEPFTKEIWSRDEARRVFADKGEAVRLVDSWSTRSGHGSPSRDDESTGRATGTISAAGRTCRRRARSGPPSS